MSEEQRAALLTDDKWDDEVVCAVLHNNPVALNMPKHEWEHFKILWQRRKYPDLELTLDRLNKAVGYATRAPGVFDGYVERQVKKLGGLTAEDASDRRRA
jgi:hypothetical protein